MLNMLVVDDNIYFSKTLINNIVQSNPNLRLCMIATDGQEATNAIKNTINIILLDLKLSKYKGLKILDYLTKNYKNNYDSSIIVISGENKIILKIRNNTLYIYNNFLL